MLEKFLPKPKKTEQKPSNLSPNLVSTDRFSPLTKYELKRQSSLLVILMAIAVPVLIAVFYLLTFFQNKTISSLQSQKETLTSELQVYEESELQMRTLAAKTELLRAAVQESKVSPDLVKEVTDKIPASITLLRASIDKDMVSLSLSSYDVMDFSRLISSYLDSSDISEITLKSADYSAERKLYKVDLDLYFK